LIFKHYPNAGFCLAGFFFLLVFKEKSPLVLTAVSTQGRSCISQVHSGPASLAPRPSPGASRTGSANAQGRGEQSSQGLTLLLVWSFAILRQQPQKCQLESKRLSKNLFQTLLVATSAFYLALFSRLQG